VVEGSGIIGTLDTCTCVVVDDDLYPRKVPRPRDIPLEPAEEVLS
jgi:hypothetical protein